MPPAAAVIPDVSADAFRALSPADRVAAITPRDSFPCTGAAWNPLAHELLLTLHHHPSGVLCAGCPADDAFLGSVCLMWAAATDSLAHLDMESLRNHTGQTSWLTYSMAIDALVAFHAQATPSQMTDLHSEALLFAAHYGDQTLRTLSQDEFLMVLSGEHDLKPPVMRLPVIYWLLGWAAKQAGSALACPDLLPTDPPTPLPTNSVLTSAQWVKELRAHGPDGDGKLCHPGLLMRLYASKERWRKESADDTSDDPWLLQLRALSSADSADFLTGLDSLASVPENKAEEHAQPLLPLARAHQLGSKAYGNINRVRTTAALVGVAKSLWLTCPAYRQPMLRADLARYVEIVEERYENNNLQDLKTKTLEEIVRLIEQPGSQALPFGDVARRLAMHDAVSDLASQSLLVVSSEDTFRQALVQTFRGIETKAGVTQITQTLKKELTSRASDAAFDWVLRRGSTPASPATGPPPPPRRPTAAGAPPRHPGPPGCPAPRCRRAPCRHVPPPPPWSAPHHAPGPGLHRGHSPYGGQRAAHSSPPHTHHPHPLDDSPPRRHRLSGRVRVGLPLHLQCGPHVSGHQHSAAPVVGHLGQHAARWLPIVLSSDVCDASAPAPAPTQATPRDRPKKDNKRPRQGDPQDAHCARPPKWDPTSAAVVVARPGQWQRQLPAPWPQPAPPPAPGGARGADTAPFNGTVRR